MPYEDLFPRTADGLRLHGWFIPARVTLAHLTRQNPPDLATLQSHAPLTLVLFHGNAENIASGFDIARRTRAAGYNLLLVDYRGYGRSENHPSEQGLYLDGEAALGALAVRTDVDPARIVLWGRSIGSAVAVHLAASRVPTAGLILESPFTSARELLRSGGAATSVLYWLSFLSSYRFDQKAAIGRVRAPLLVLHGTDDEVVPFALGRQLFDLAPGRKEFVAVPGGGHNDLWALHDDEMWESIARFLLTLN